MLSHFLLQVQHQGRTVSLRVSERIPDDSGTGRGERLERAIHRKIPNRSPKRRESSYSKRSCG